MSSSSCDAGLAPPPPPSAPDSGQSFVFYGVLLCEVAVFMIAMGSDLQKFALTMVPKSRRCLCGLPCDASLWILGLVTYFGGNMVYTVALAFAPASLCAALMATVVVANALISRVLLKERLQRCDYHGGVCIMGGIALTAAYAPYVTVEYSAVDIGGLILNAGGLLYIIFLVFVCVGSRRARTHTAPVASRGGRALACTDPRSQCARVVAWGGGNTCEHNPPFDARKQCPLTASRAARDATQPAAARQRRPPPREGGGPPRSRHRWRPGASRRLAHDRPASRAGTRQPQWPRGRTLPRGWHGARHRVRRVRRRGAHTERSRAGERLGGKPQGHAAASVFRAAGARRRGRRGRRAALKGRCMGSTRARGERGWWGGGLRAGCDGQHRRDCGRGRARPFTRPAEHGGG